MEADQKRALGGAALTVAALGVVFGDIGTSPIYTIQTAFNPADPHPIQATADHVYGVASLIFWAVTLIVTVKYVGLVMSADNDGEGGIMALISQIRQLGDRVSGRTKFLLGGLGVFGAALFFGDSMITPAISVLSAVEGTKTIASSMDSFVVPITVTIIVLLFLLQRLGSGAVGRVFGPVMLVWFTTIAVLGIRGITMHPEVLKALSPSYALRPPLPQRLDRVLRADLGRARLHRGGGAVRRHGPLRPPGDHPCLAAARLPGVHPELPRAGGPDPRRPERDQRSVLQADAARTA